MIEVVLVKFEPISEYDTNLIWFLWILIEYDRVFGHIRIDPFNTFNKLVIFVLICLTRI